MHYSWLLLDADGTLFDYDRAETKALAYTFEQTGLTFNDDYTNTYRQINGSIWQDFERGKITQQAIRAERFRRLFNTLGIDAHPVDFGERYLTNLGRQGDLIDGALDLLQALYGNCKLLLITNGIAEVQRSRLSRSPIQDYFEAIIISGEVGFSKPHPGIFDAAFQAMDHPPKRETLIVGDSLTSDIQGGLNYGIDTCWYNPQRAPRNAQIVPRFEINHLHELLSLISLTH